MIIQFWRLPRSLAAALLASSFLAPRSVCAGPTVDISMRAAFSSPPYLVELLETAASENATCYFPLLDRIASGYFPSAATEKELYESFLQLVREDGHLTSPETLSTFKLALSMRSAAPRIAAHYQFYETAVEPLLESPQDGCVNWFLSDGLQHCLPTLESAGGKVEGKTHLHVLPFDRVIGHGSQELVLYADITSAEFGEYHKAAMGLVQHGTHSYRLRYTRAPDSTFEMLPINGYGVELALKKTDYIVIDDRDADAGAAPQVGTAADMLDVEEEVADLKPLSTSELSPLGMKAASFIMQSDDPFDSLVRLTQDFPKYSTSMAAHNVSEAFETEHSGNRLELVPAGVNVLWVNGLQLIERMIEPFSLVDLLHQERKLINGVLDLGLNGAEAVSLLGHSEVAAAKADDQVLRFDWRDEMEDGRVIIWLNNLEKDKRYAEYSDNLGMLLQPTMPGSLPSVKRDIFTLIVPVDLSNPDDLVLVVQQLMVFVKRKLPVRFGLVPLTQTSGAVEQAKITYHLLEDYGLAAMALYLEKSLESGIAADGIKAAYDAAIDGRERRAQASAYSFADLPTSEYHDDQIQLAQRWAARLHANSAVPPIFVNGFPITRDPAWMQAMSQRLSQDLRFIQEAVYFRLIEENMWVPGYFLENAVARRNAYIYPEDRKALTVLNVNKIYTEHTDLFDGVAVIDASKESTMDDWAVLTIVADLTSEEGKTLLFQGLQFRKANAGVRLDIVPNTAAQGESVSPAAAANSNLVANVGKLLDLESVEELDALLQGPASASSSQAFDVALASFLSAAAMRAGDNMLILNGRVIGPIASAADFTEVDFAEFLKAERSSRILPVYKAIEDLRFTDKVLDPLAAAKMTSITALSTISDVPEGIFETGPKVRITAFNIWNSTYTAFETGDKDTATIHVVALVNPASEQGQRWAPILKVLSELDGVYMKIWLNPKDQLTELPVKRFFRYVLESAPSFDDSGKLRSLSATFGGLPSEALLTAGTDVPPAWLVSSKVSVHDLDNIKLGSIKTDVTALYELENILIEGHSKEPDGPPTRGVQLVLASENNPHFADTIIMENLGFFQFKANPGYYNIRLEEGPSSDIFDIESVGGQGMKPVPGDNGTEVVLMDFMGRTLYPRLIRTPGMEEADVLGELAQQEEKTGGAMDFVAKGLRFAEGILGGAAKTRTKAKSSSDEEHAEINIFSVASGHLYERMLNIMMVSVMRHTNHTVKFWFIEQFLSPSFKDFIPTMAEEYGFRYEMVTYKWPHWLREQKEKQREIWGYKILFLDVLFPLSLDKVIFVDADQIVRTDMYDLVQVDLKGAPYGFTPMCDSREEMEGFRFWKQGYWASYLRGMPYHISALYVVDLRRFRALASGDRLRQTYHQLSADPESLANLDQDLPNHMQTFQIPIFSLPQDWLWCETWCSDESLETARTIDLCNNPLTKEPKLDRARRQVPEWTVYDDEIAALAKRKKAEKAGAADDKVVGGGEESTHSKKDEL